MSRTIVVGVDGSTDSGTALDWAAAEAQLHTADLLILFGVHMPIATVPFGDGAFLPPSDHVRDYANQIVDAAAKRATAVAPDVEVRTKLVMREPSHALIDASAEASMVVVGTRGLGGLGALALGSVSSRVASAASCPTVVVPPAEPIPQVGESIVVGVDNSPHGTAALRFALDEASRRSMRVDAIYVYNLPLYERPVLETPGLSPEMITRFHDQERTTAAAFIERAVQEGLRDTGVEVDVSPRAIDGHPADVLVDESRDAGMTVVGSRGLGEFRGLLLGSVSRSVLHRANHPVVVVHGRKDTNTDR